MSLIPWRKKEGNGGSLATVSPSMTRLRDEVESLFSRFANDPWGWT